MKIFYRVMFIVAVLLSYVMCIYVAYNYASLLYCGKYEGCSAPASTAFLLMIPFLICILIFAVVGFITKKIEKSKK